MNQPVHVQVNPASMLAGEITPERIHALAAKLTEGSLAGAVLDALPQEPLPPESPLWTTPNLIITPHCGLYDPTAYGPRCLQGFFANLRRYRAGQPLEHVVLHGRGY